MTSSLLLNGADLSTLVSNVESIAGLLRTPARRNTGVAVPGRHGWLRRDDRPFDAVEKTLPFWIIGADAITGASLSGDAAVTAFYEAHDTLLSRLHAPTLQFDHGLPGGVVRRTTAELLGDPLDCSLVLGSPLFGRMDVTISVLDAFAVDPTPAETGPFSLTSGGTRVLTEFAGATAPMADLSVTFIGPISNPELRQPATGSFVAYDGVIGSGQTLTVHCDDTAPVPLVGTGGLVPNYALLRYLPPRWFELDPSAGLTVSLTHTGGGSASCSVTGRRKYLTG